MGRHRQPTIEEIKEFVVVKGGQCLSNAYVNAKTHMQWSCCNEHEFEAIWNNIQQGKWCPKCANNQPDTIENMKALAENRNGKCLSAEYSHSHKNLEWMCEKEHTWFANPTNIKSGQWCPKCGRLEAANKLKSTIESIKLIAISRGGECLSEKYINSQTKLEFKCKYNHKWNNTPNNIKNGQWCPECSEGLGERLCRKFFEKLFNKPFPKSYPKWLKFPSGSQGELDGYCEEIGIAFEHHGQQHYKQHYYHRNATQKFSLQIERDKLKATLCKKKEVKLIVIPEIFKMTKLNNLKKVITKQLKAQKIPIPRDVDLFELADAYQNAHANDALNLMQGIALSKGGKCLSKQYVGSGEKLMFVCKRDHNFSATADNIRAGHWCGLCAGNVKLTLEQMQQIAKSKNGKCLSTEYVNSHTYILWECEKKHIFESTPSNVMHSNGWCNLCKTRTPS